MPDVNVNEVLGDTVDADYIDMVYRLRQAGAAAAERGHDETAQDLAALEAACYLAPQPGKNPPYRAFITAGNLNSGDLSVISPDQAQRLERLLPDINAPLVRGRVADVLWLVSSKEKRFAFAIEALSAFAECDFGEERWFSTGEETARRAWDLGRSLRAAAQGHLLRLRDDLLDRLLNADGRTYYASRIADVLLDSRLALERGAEVAEHLESCSRPDSDSATLDLRRAVDYAAGAVRWWSAIQDSARAAAAQGRVGELLVMMADSQGTGTEGGSNLAGSAVLRDALKAYRAVPRKFRIPLGVDTAIEDVLFKLRAAGELGLSEMHAFTSDPINLTEAVEQAQGAVRGKDLFDALAAFCGLLPFTDADEARITAERELESHPLQSLFGVTHYSHDGRVVRKVPPVGNPGSPDYEEAVWARIVRHHGFRVALAVNGGILPALDVMRVEHFVGVREILTVTRRSSVVPLQDEVSVAVGLAAGFEGDWITAVHVLAPHLENMVRQALKSAGAQTTVIDDRVENEVGLGALLAMPAAEEVLGANLLLELRATFTDPLGPNLRNEVAHGLLSDAAAYGNSSAYAWWLCLRIVYLPFLAAVSESSASSDDAGTATTFS